MQIVDKALVSRTRRSHIQDKTWGMQKLYLLDLLLQTGLPSNTVTCTPNLLFCYTCFAMMLEKGKSSARIVVKKASFILPEQRSLQYLLALRGICMSCIKVSQTTYFVLSPKPSRVSANMGSEARVSANMSSEGQVKSEAICLDWSLGTISS